MFKKLLKTTALLALVLALVACGSNGESNNSSTGTSGNEGEEVFKIGLHYELTGEVADYGTAEQKGSSLAIKLANEEAGYERFQKVEYDNKSDTTESVTIATTLASDGVAGVVGPATSGASAATYQIMNDAGIVVISPSATQTNITLRNPDDPSSEAYEYIFRVCFEDAYQGAAMGQYAYDKLGAEKAVIYQDSASDYAKGLEVAFKEQFEKLGGEVVSTEYYVAKDTDFSSVLTNIKNMDYDVLYIAGYYNEAGLIIKQAREMGIDKIILGGDGFDSESLVELAGNENLNDVYFTTAYTTINASEDLQNFIEAYKAEFNEEPSMFSALAFDATNVLIDGLNEVGKGGEELRDSIWNVNFNGITGEFTFDETNSPVKSVLVVKLIDGVQSDAESISPEM